MIRRLVLGDGTLGRHLVTQLDDVPGELYVVTADTGWVTTLRDESIAAVEGDPTNSQHYPSVADIVVIAAETVDQTESVAETAREVFPDASLIAAVGLEASDDTRRRVAATVDRLLDPHEELANRLLDATATDPAGGMGLLLSTIRSLSKPLAVVAHDNPDPDAIASACGLVAIAELVGVPADAYYFGEISHQENRALVNLLDLSLYPVETESFDPDEYGTIALVDHAQAGVNDSLPPETEVGVVVDHHPPRMPIDKTDRYVDIRPAVGSTSTIITEYFRRLGMRPDQPLATALLYGIQTDTKGFTREVSTADFEAASELSELANSDDLKRIESPSVSRSVVDTLATAIKRRDVRGSALASCVGRISDRDALAQTADDLLNMEGITTVIVYGYTDEMIYVSGRTRGTPLDLGAVFRDALDQIGSAGGHANMAGAQLPLGIIRDVDNTEDLTTVVHELVAERIFSTLDVASEPAVYMINPPLDGSSK